MGGLTLLVSVNWNNPEIWCTVGDYFVIYFPKCTLDSMFIKLNPIVANNNFKYICVARKITTV